MLNEARRVLLLAPHTDDGEFACGGTIARFIAESKDCFYVAFSSCDASLPVGSKRGLLLDEMTEATRILGIKDCNRITFDYEVRQFPQFRQAILEDMVKLYTDITPDLVLLPSRYDTHQDHGVIASEGFRAYKRCSILGYELPCNNLSFVSSGFIEFNADHLRKKIAALKCYRTQANRDYASPEYVEALARTRGVQIGVRFAEAYEVIRTMSRL